MLRAGKQPPPPPQILCVLNYSGHGHVVILQEAKRRPPQLSYINAKVLSCSTNLWTQGQGRRQHDKIIPGLSLTPPPPDTDHNMMNGLFWVKGLHLRLLGPKSIIVCFSVAPQERGTYPSNGSSMPKRP